MATATRPVRAKRAPKHPAKKRARKAPVRRGHPLIALRLEAEHIQALRDEAQSRGMTVSELIREGILPVYDRRLRIKHERKESVSV